MAELKPEKIEAFLYWAFHYGILDKGNPVEAKGVTIDTLLSLDNAPDYSKINEYLITN